MRRPEHVQQLLAEGYAGVIDTEQAGVVVADEVKKITGEGGRRICRASVKKSKKRRRINTKTYRPFVTSLIMR